MHDDSTGPPPKPNDRLSEDLGALYRAELNIPRSLDDAILNRARAQLAPRHSRQLILRIGALITAAAAVIVIVLHLSSPPASHDATHATIAMQQGSVDIVDALKLAKRIRAGQTDPSRDDINHDGTVDQHDVDAIAMAAVRLPEARVQ